MSNKHENPRSSFRTDIVEMHRAFNLGGRKAIETVMRDQPAVFLKLLVLLVPREREVTHSGTVKSMSDDQIEATIEAIQAMLARREAGENAKVIEGVETVASPAPGLMAVADAKSDKRSRQCAHNELDRDMRD